MLEIPGIHHIIRSEFIVRENHSSIPALRHVLLDIIEKNFVRPEGKYWEMSQVSEHYNTINPTIEEPEAGENILNKKCSENRV